MLKSNVRIVSIHATTNITSNTHFYLLHRRRYAIHHVTGNGTSAPCLWKPTLSEFWWCIIVHRRIYFVNSFRLLHSRKWFSFCFFFHRQKIVVSVKMRLWNGIPWNRLVFVQIYLHEMTVLNHRNVDRYFRYNSEEVEDEAREKKEETNACSI